MTESCNPIYIKGKRNIFCPLYRECLDHASKNHWEYWACNDCENRQITEAVSDVFLSTQHNDLPYALSPTLFLKTKAFSV